MFGTIRGLVLSPFDWERKTWGRIDVETLEEIERPYPEGSANVAFQIGLAALAGQDSRQQTLDNKIALGAALVLGIGAIVPAALAVSGRKVGEATLVLAAAAGFMLLIAFAHSMRAMWPSRYRGAPEPEDIWQYASEHHAVERQEWAAAASLRQAIKVNDRILEARVAAFKAVWVLIAAGMALAVAALAIHFTRDEAGDSLPLKLSAGPAEGHRALKFWAVGVGDQAFLDYRAPDDTFGNGTTTVSGRGPR